MTFSIVMAILVFGGILLYVALAGSKKVGRSGKGYYEPTMTANHPTLDTAMVKTRWAEIVAMQNTPSGLKNALFEADKLLDYVMQAKGFGGDTMGERLQSSTARTSYRDLNAIWSAHKLRNQMAHEVNHDFVPQQVRDAIDNLGNGIRDLGVEL